MQINNSNKYEPALSTSFASPLPIEALNERIQSFTKAFPSSGLGLHFVCTAWPIDIHFSTDPKMSADDLLTKIVQHFDLTRHVNLEGGGFVVYRWRLAADGNVISELPFHPEESVHLSPKYAIEDMPLDELGVKDGATLVLLLDREESRVESR